MSKERQLLGKRLQIFDTLAIPLGQFLLRGIEHFGRPIDAGNFLCLGGGKGGKCIMHYSALRRLWVVYPLDSLPP